MLAIEYKVLQAFKGLGRCHDAKSEEEEADTYRSGFPRLPDVVNQKLTVPSSA